MCSFISCIFVAFVLAVHSIRIIFLLLVSRQHELLKHGLIIRRFVVMLLFLFLLLVDPFGSLSENWRARQNSASAGQKNDPNVSYKITLF